MSTLALDVRLDRHGFALAVQQDIALEGITAIFGPSGSGKTTLLRIVAGLERAASGNVTFDGTVWQTAQRMVPAHQRGIGYVFQDGRLFAHLTVRANLEFAARRSARTTITFDDAVAALDLAPLLDRRPASLSGGEQQRVAIARALLTCPRLLLMDEPLSSLDVGRKREILPLIEQLPRRFGVPVLYVTHNVDEAARLAGHVLLLRAGRATGFGTIAEVFHGPALEPLTHGLEPGAVLHTRVTAHSAGTATLAVGTETLRVAMTDAAIGAMRPVRIHARDVAIATERPRNLSIRNVLGARILRIDASTSGNVDVLLDIDGQQLKSRITRDACEELHLSAGQDVFVLIKSVALESTLLG